MTGYVYFLECGDFVKIGFSKKPDDRFHSLKVSLPFKIKYVRQISGNIRDEKKLHLRFKKWHVKGEWFKKCDEINSVIFSGTFPLGHDAEKHQIYRLNRVLRKSSGTTAIGKAIDIAGGQRALADEIGTSQAQVWFWLHKSKKGVAAEFVLPIESVTGVSKSELRPDIYPKK